MAALVASIAYAALFLLLGTVSRHAVVFGLVYALVWEALFGSLVAGRPHAERPAVVAGRRPEGRPAVTWSPRTSD